MKKVYSQPTFNMYKVRTLSMICGSGETGEDSTGSTMSTSRGKNVSSGWGYGDDNTSGGTGN